MNSKQCLYNMNMFLCNQINPFKPRFSTSQKNRQKAADNFQGISGRQVSSFEDIFPIFCFMVLFLILPFNFLQRDPQTQ
jgi:hypothetical protein